MVFGPLRHTGPPALITATDEGRDPSCDLQSVVRPEPKSRINDLRLLDKCHWVHFGEQRQEYIPHCEVL